MDKIDLKKCRKLLKLTQAEIAVKADLSREMIVHYESGKFPIPHTFAMLIKQLLKSEGIAYPEKESNFSGLVSEPSTEYNTHNKAPNLNNRQISTTVLSTATTSAVSLELLCELVSFLTKEPIDVVKGRSRQLMQVKSVSYETFLGSLI